MKGKPTRRDFLKCNVAAIMGAQVASAVGEPVAAGSGREGYRIFSEGRIAGLKLKNRLVRAATAEGASPGGFMNQDGLLIYESLARGGVGLIITGHIVAARGGDAHENQTHIDDDRYIETLKKLTAAVHRNGPGCKIVAQITHAGPGAIKDPVAASEMPGRPSGPTPRVLAPAEIADLIAQFVKSIGRAREAGFDGVEIHAAHGYLLRTFVSGSTNNRTDEFGGSPARRAEIIRRIVAGARGMVGNDFPILLKMNCDDHGSEAAALRGFVEIAGEIERAGVNGIEISGTSATRTGIDAPAKESYFLPYADRLTLKVPVILTGGNRSVESLEKIVGSGNVQFFGFARPLVREPNLPSRWLERKGSDTTTCISCNDCLRNLAKAPTHCTRI